MKRGKINNGFFAASNALLNFLVIYEALNKMKFSKNWVVLLQIFEKAAPISLKKT